MDGQSLAGTGFPQASTKSLPRGLDNCPLPDIVVVHFRGYTGRGIFPNLPRTWIPIPAEEVASKSSTRLLRVNIPLRLAWSLTIHKCQGLTAVEGTIIFFLRCQMKA